MFSEEIKTLRRLGFRHVCRPFFAPGILMNQPTPPTGPPPGPQLCFCPHLGSHDLEGPRTGHKYRVTDCRRPQVRGPFSLVFRSARRRIRVSRTITLSGSMEPAFYRGDLLFLVNPPNKRYETGDITVYRIPGQDIPIVHRVLETHDVVKAVNGFVPFFSL